ncbi:cytochrome P450 [Streptomyces sp. NPDC059070]|uniref:cytochrome P450 n=1 Tax=Streptomyces sp. NPDC059070 TaxID=3346713 RepID=UPI0036A5DB9B
MPGPIATLVLLRRPLDLLAALATEGELAELRIGPVRALVVCDPELTQQLLRDDRTFDKGGIIFDQIREAVGNGLATCPHADHRRRRRLVQPALHRSRLPEYASIISDEFDRLTAGWAEGERLDVVAEMTASITNTLAAAMFAGRLEKERLDHMRADTRTVMAAIARRAFLPRAINRLPIPANRRFDRANARLRGELAALVAAGRYDDHDHDDLLSALLRPPPGEDAALTDTELTDELVTFFMGGVDTTGNTLAWSLHLLASRPEAQQRLHDEVDSVLGGRAAHHADLPALPWTHAVIKETLRLYPPGWLLTRTTTADSVLGKHHIPAGTTIAYSPYLLHHRADLYPDPDTFDPERSHTRGAYIPFGGGARKCPGEDFALTQAVIALATITARWQLLPDPAAHVRPYPNLALTPHGLYLYASRRSHGSNTFTQ